MTTIKLMTRCGCSKNISWSGTLPPEIKIPLYREGVRFDAQMSPNEPVYEVRVFRLDPNVMDIEDPYTVYREQQ